MKDFDVTRTPASLDERTFQLGGETFTRRTGVRPEALVGFDELKADTPPGEVLKIVDGLILSLIAPDEAEAWKALRAREEDPVTLGDMNAVASWLVEQEADRPTKQSAPSSRSRGRSGTSSTEGSSSPVTPEPTPLASVPS